MKAVAKKYGVVGGLFLLTAVCCFAQTSTFGVKAHNIADEMIEIAKWLGVIILIIAGLVVASGHGQAFARLSNTIIGILVALESASLIAWLAT